jgi:hypothetical protein
MKRYKRNQVEEAISAIVEPRSNQPSSELRTRLKRLLETDRGLEVETNSDDPFRAHFAFYSAEAPGSGTEIWFSEYEAFALLSALQLMVHGWPQSFAVSVLRRARPELEVQHARVLKGDPKVLFDGEAIRRGAQAGDFAFDTIDPVLLIIISRSGSAVSEQEEPIACAVRAGAREAMKFIGEARARAWTMFEMTTMAHRLLKELAKTEPRRRGRG